MKFASGKPVVILEGEKFTVYEKLDRLQIGDKVLYANGSIYEGESYYGTPSGNGKYHYASGIIDEGYFSAGKLTDGTETDGGVVTQIRDKRIWKGVGVNLLGMAKFTGTWNDGGLKGPAEVYDANNTPLYRSLPAGSSPGYTGRHNR
ncbi:MAG: hypothetical protein R3C68_05115 [Myxococcota bacterium]